MTKNGKCPHLKDLRTKKGKRDFSITLYISGSYEGFVLCPECFKIIKDGGYIKSILGNRMGKPYKIFRAWETASEPMWFELRTEWIKSE